MGQDIFQMIEDRLHSFSKGKQQIATYILQNFHEAAFQTAAVIGKAVKISESTVVRFAGDLGFKGFPEFQKALQQVAMKRLQEGQYASSEGSRLNDLSLSVNEEALGAAARELLQCRSFYVLSNQLGRLLLPFCRYCGEQLLEPVIVLPSDTRERLFAGLSQLEPGDLLLILAIGDLSCLDVFSMEQGRRLGARILLLTDSQDPDILALGDETVSLPPCGRDPVPDLSQAVDRLQKLFCLWDEGRKEQKRKQKKMIEEIWDAYEKYEWKSI